MTDVVAIAKKCRSELTNEIARLDEFIRMAEKLQQYEALATSGVGAPSFATRPAPSRDGTKT